MGGISERSVSDGVVGPTFACIIAHQFNDLRRSDRFFYETQDPSIRFTSGMSKNINLFISMFSFE
jgi:peroxidase